MKYFISFIEEGIMNPKYYDYIGGRIEVCLQESNFNIEEIRFFTKDKNGFNHLRELWDWTSIEEDELEDLREIIIDNYQEE